MSCSVEGISLESDFPTDSFSNTGVVRWMSDLPRFGYGSALENLIDGTNREGEEYLRGIFVSGILVIIFFVLWIAVIALFAYLGQQRVGFLSGRQAKKSKKGDPSPETPTGPQTIEALRVWVMFACTSIILCSIILCTRAVENLTNSLDTTRDVFSLGRDRLQQGINLIDSMVEAQTVAQTDYQALFADATISCPDLPTVLCGDGTLTAEECLISTLPVDQDITSVLEVLRGEPGGSFVFPQIVEIRKDLVDSQLVLLDLDAQAETFTRIFHAAISFAAVMSAFSVVLLVAVSLAWLDKFPYIFQQVLRFLVLPLFMVFVLLSLVLSSTFITGSYILADFCVDSPDRHVLALVERFSDQLNPMISNFIMYYIRGCPVESLPREIVEQFDYVVSLLPAVDQIADSIATTQTFADQFCNGNGASLTSFGDVSNRQVCAIAELLSDAQSLFECPSIRGLYELSVYDAICYSGTNGFSWVGSTQFIIVFMAFSVLTCRIVLYPVDESHNDGDDDTRRSPSSPGSTTEMSVGSSRARSRIYDVEPDQSGGAFEIGYGAQRSRRAKRLEI